jgi:hypothetical protein
MLNHFLARHADAIIADGNGARILIIGNMDIQLNVLFQQIGIRQGSKTQAVDRV